MFGEFFLIVLGLLWIVFASVQDLKTREVANWLSFSLIIFALGFRFFYSLFALNNFWFFYYGLIGLGAFFILGNLFYYGRIFAGGDAKLMIALGTILPLSLNWFSNLKIVSLFFVVFLFAGAIYGFVWAGILAGRNWKSFKKEFARYLKERRILFMGVMFFGLLIMFLGFFEGILFFSGALVFLLPYFYCFAKSVDEVCMIKKIKPSELREGDWLYKDVRVGGKVVKQNWEGLETKDIKLLKTKKFVVVREGIPFVPVFLISFLVLIYVKFFTGFSLF